MGGGGSKEVVLPGQGKVDSAAARTLQDDLAQYERQKAVAAMEYRDAEDAIMTEGYKRGRRETLESMQDEIAKAARVAYAQEALQDEANKAQALAAEVDKLRKTQIRPPVRDVACKPEEAAYLACQPGPSNDDCSTAVKAYVACAQAVTAQAIAPERRLA